jgi:hypothetical protein
VSSWPSNYMMAADTLPKGLLVQSAILMLLERPNPQARIRCTPSVIGPHIAEDEDLQTAVRSFTCSRGLPRSARQLRR